jgi:uncharacterized membrane protein
MAAARPVIGEGGRANMSWLKRFLRHVWMSPIILHRQFPVATLDAIGRAVAAGEKLHRGQVRFVLEAELTSGQLWSGVSARQRAIDVFSLLRVWDTEENNGVLIYLLLADRKVEIVADRGIHRHAGDERWRAICREIEHHYRKGDFLSGSVAGIEKISTELAFYFPANGQHANEQPDAPVVM